MANIGVAPPDPTTLVGQFRIIYGDSDFTELDPPVSGQGEYSELSDTEIESFLTMGRDSVIRAIGFYYLALAGQAAKKSTSVTDYDLRVDLTKRAGDLREQAQYYFRQADEEDEREGFTDIFDSFEFGDRDCRVPELDTCPCMGRCWCA